MKISFIGQKASIFLCFLLMIFGIGQTPKDFGKNIVKQLSSKEMAGRGYTHDGMHKAATFINDQFKKIGLKSFNGSFFQSFSYPINSIEDCELSINGKKLVLGTDYLVNALSPSSQGSYKPNVFSSIIMDSIYVDNNFDYYYDALDNLANNAVVFPLVTFPENYTSNGLKAKYLYNKIAESIIDNSASEKIPLVIQLSNNELLHTVSQQQSKTAGFTVLKGAIKLPIHKIQFNIKSNFIPNFKAENVVGFIEGIKKDSAIFITAHYDHLGQIGDIYFPGANDNASGVAFILAMAKFYKLNPPKYTMIFVAFAGEEASLMGSQYFVKNSPIPLKKIKFLFNFDIMGTGEQGIQIVNSTKYPKVYKALNAINIKHSLLKNIKKRGESCNSDHCSFDRVGVPSFFTYTLGGVSYYHNVLDKEETLPLTKFNDILYLFTQYIDGL